MAAWVRQGLQAGVSTVLAFLAGALTNVFTSGWSWPVGVGLGVLVAGWVGWEMRQAAKQVTAVPSPDTAAEPEPVVPHQLPPAARHFAGRESELAILADLLEQPCANSMVILAVWGTAGVGKTALAVHWAHRVADQFPDGQLYVNLRGFDPGGSVMPPAEAVRGFLEAFEVPQQRIPASVEAQTALYRSLTTGRRVLVVLDNARDAEHVRTLLPGSASCLALVTSRDQLSSLVTLEGAHPVALGVLSTPEARQALARRLGDARLAAEPDAVDEIMARTARLPLALAIVAARAATRPQLKLSALAGQLRDVHDRLNVLGDRDAASDVRSVLSWSYQIMSIGAARLFRLLGLHPGPDISGPAAASLGGLPLAEARPLLAELTDANMLTEHVLGRYAFHDLLRAYAMEQTRRLDTEDERRAATHRMLDHYVHTAHAAALLLYPARDPISLTPPQPGVSTERPTDHTQALTWFNTEHPVLLAVTEYAAAIGLDTHTWQLAWTLANYFDRQGHWHDAAATQRAAVAAAQRLDDPSAQALTHRLLARANTQLGLPQPHTGSWRRHHPRESGEREPTMDCCGAARAGRQAQACRGGQLA